VDPDFGWSQYAAGTYLTVREALFTMLAESDNGAALALVDQLGVQAVNARFASLGMLKTHLNHDATTTPRDMLTFFTLLAEGQVISPDVNDRIPAGLPDGADWRVAHKTGNVDNLIGDAGILYVPNGTYALVILNQSAGSGAAAPVVQAIARCVYGAIALSTNRGYPFLPEPPAPIALDSNGQQQQPCAVDDIGMRVRDGQNGRASQPVAW
jgi:beta-lactamase class A